jgi:hypothetical protein
LTIVRGYESELEDDDDDVDESEGFSVQETTHYFMSESAGNSDCEMSREIERSQEICVSCPQSVARPTAEDLSSDAEIRVRSEEGENSSGQASDASTASVSGEASPSTSPEAVLLAPYISFSSSDEYSEIVPLSNSKRKGPPSRRDCESSIYSSHSQHKQHKKHARPRAEDLSSAVEIRGRSEEEENSPGQASDASTASVGGAASPSTSPEAVLPAAGVSGSNNDGASEIVRLSNSKRKGPPSRRDCESSIYSSHSRHKQQKKHARPRAEDLSSAVEIRGRSEEEENSSGQAGDASTASVSGEAPPSTSPEAVLAAAYMSDSSSDADTEIALLTTVNRKRPAWWVYSDSSSDSSDSPSETLKNSEKPTYTAEQAVGNSGDIRVHRRYATSTTEDTERSSNSDGNSEKCPICLVTFRAQEVGTPDNCNHFFCTGCLEQWSANANTCPVDRQEFNVILVRHYPDGEVIRRIPVSPRQIQICVLCGENDIQNSLINCEECSYFYHPECMISVLNTIHFSEWICPVCYAAMSDIETD